MAIRWFDVFLDRPREAVDAAAGFWSSVTASTLSPWRADHRFVTLLPPRGRDYLRVQAVDALVPRGGVHLDLQVDDVGGEAARLEALGATVRYDSPRLVVLASPAGIAFCLTPYAASPTDLRPPPVGAPASRVDQVTVDVPTDRFPGEGDFWEAVTGWDRLRGSLPQFQVLRAPGWGSEPDEAGQGGPPVRFLLQRLDDPTGPAGLHLDLACADRAATTARHVELGARVRADFLHWTVLTDPAGGTYCLTDRDPASGTLPA